MISRFFSRGYFLPMLMLVFLFVFSLPAFSGTEDTTLNSELAEDSIEQIGPLYAVEPPVHQWIALQAYNALMDGTPMKTEIGDYLPTNADDPHYSSNFSYSSNWSSDDDDYYDSATALIEGACEEDKGDIHTPEWIPIIGGASVRSLAHFWDPDGAYDHGLIEADGLTEEILDFLTSNNIGSALETAQMRFDLAIVYYNAGDKALAYYYLGRTAHLLMDMSVPAHSLLDPHGGDWITGDDEYEEYTADHYREITSADSIVGDIQPYGGAPAGYTQGLCNLFYTLAEKSNDFDSDDRDGEYLQYGKGKYTLGRNALDASKTFSHAEYWDWELLQLGYVYERDLYRNVDYDVFRSCSNSNEYHIYYYRDFYEIYSFSDHIVKAYYTDGSSEFVSAVIDRFGDVPTSVLECIYHDQLQTRAIGFTALLYQLFWDLTEHPGEEGNDFSINV